MKLSKTQEKAIAQIKEISRRKNGDVWICADELDGVYDKTLYALCHTHGLLNSKKEYGLMSYTNYYKLKEVSN